jgi:hypothetical protein
MKTHTLLPLSLFVAVLPTSFACAEKAPLSVDELASQASAIVVARIDRIRVESEPSRFERGSGNSDWGIYLTLRVETIEKGNVSDEQLEARCFRIRSRSSMAGYLTPSGHHPVPAIGARVRVYLERENDSWSVVLPNGITSVEHANGLPGGSLHDAPEVTQLQSRKYTYVLPSEIWMLLIVLGSLMLLAGILLGRWFRTHRLRR